MRAFTHLFVEVTPGFSLKKSIESNSYVFNHLKTLVSDLNGYYISCDIRAGSGFVTGCRIGFCD